MTPLSELQVAAALSENVYRRDPRDQSLDVVQDIGATFTAPQSLSGTSLTFDSGYYYNDATGFVGSITEFNGNIFVTYRGTDNSGSFEDTLANLAADYLGWVTGANRSDPKDYSEANSKLSNGTLGRSQLNDALDLYDIAKRYAGSTKDVIVVGQSLGGGLAGLVTALRETEGYAFAPAPFANQLAVEATFQALQEIGISRESVPQNFVVAPQTIGTNYVFREGGNLLKQFLIFNFNLSDVQADAVLVDRQAILTAFEDRTSDSLNVHTITGEALTSGKIGQYIPGAQFTAEHSAYNVGFSAQDVSVTESVGLHGAALHNLVIRTTTEQHKFDTLLQGNSALTHILLNTQSGAALDHDRIDPDGTSKQLAAGPNPAALYNLLWKEVGAEGGKGLYDYFYTLFNEVIKYGAAGTPQALDERGLNSGLIKSALSVLRDAIQGSAPLAGGAPPGSVTAQVVKDRLGGVWDFAGSIESGVPFSDKVVIDTTRITSQKQEQKDTGFDLGRIDISRAIVTAMVAALEASGIPTIAAREYAVSLLGDRVIPIAGGSFGDIGLLDWEIAVAQAGSNAGTLIYSPDENKITNRSHSFKDSSHVIFGGDAGSTATNGAYRDDLTGSSKDDYILGGAGKDKLSGRRGEDLLVGGGGKDTASYWDAANNINIEQVLDFSSARTQELKAGIIRMKDDGDGTTDANGDGFIDTLVSIERIELSKQADQFGLLADQDIAKAAKLLPEGLTIDGGHGGAIDTLDLGGAGKAVFLGSATTGEDAVEIFGGYEASTFSLRAAYTALVAEVEKTGRGFYDPSKLRFSGFEKVVGTAFDDRLDLLRLTPGGELTEAQAAALLAKQKEPLVVGAADPAAVADAFDGRILEMQTIAPQLSQHVEINGGAGNDLIRGPAWGNAIIKGEAGNDTLFSAGLNVTLDGGEGNDILYGGYAYRSNLIGGSGNDLFSLGHNTYVKDATKDDYIFWDTAFLVTGGVKNAWQEGGWAYSGSFYNMLSTMVPSAGLTASTLLMYQLAPLLPADLGLFRYSVSNTGQLIIQTAAGLGGQAVVENYAQPNVGIDDTQAGNITVFQTRVGDFSFTEFKKTLKALLHSSGLTTTGTDPLILDLDGDGVELVRLDDSSTYFDLDANGFAERTAWVRPDDGFLARDLNGNARIDDISELFGSATVSGFSQLAALDGNHDGVINSIDAAFGDLKIWRDLNQNGVTDAGELQSLQAAGIQSISVTGTAPSNDEIRGTTIRAEAVFTRADGSSSKVVDALLGTDLSDTRYLGATTVSPAAGAEPELKGAGNIRDLRVAMTSDATLLSAVSAFGNLPVASSWAAFKAAAAPILYRWAGVDQTASTAMTDRFDAQKLAFLEMLAGRTLVDRDGSGHPLLHSVDELVDSWNTSLDRQTVRLVVQGPLSQMFSGLSFDKQSDVFVAEDATALSDILRSAISALPSGEQAALADWSALYGPLLAAVTRDTVRADGNAVLSDFIVQSLVTALESGPSPLTLSQLVAGLDLNNVTIGTGGADSLQRNAETGTHVFVGGPGDDILTGGRGQDVYVFGSNFGSDTIIDVDKGAVGDRIRFAAHTADQITLARQGADLVISINGTTDKVVVKDQFATIVRDQFGTAISPDHSIEEIQFKDGTILEAVDIAMLVGRGTSASETIIGSSGKDYLRGLAGNDTLKGGDDSDVYIFGAGDGADVIEESKVTASAKGGDTLLFLTGIAREDLTFVRTDSSDDILIKLADEGDSVLIKGQFAYTPLGVDTPYDLDSRIEAFFLTDGGSFNWQQLQKFVIDTYTTDGNDYTYGYGTSDVFFSSKGDDYLSGLDGSDTYHFDLGTGRDAIDDASRYVNTPFSDFVGGIGPQDDTLVFGQGITRSDVTFTRLGENPDLLITIAGSTDQITIIDQFHGIKLDLLGMLGMAWFGRIETFKFADGVSLSWEDVLHIVTTGTDGDDIIYGAYYPDIIDGKSGDDILSGGNDGDTYIFGRGYGNDTIREGRDNVLTPAEDTVKFKADVAVSDVVFTHVAGTNHLLISIVGSTDTLLIENQYQIIETGPFGAQEFNQIERFEWADGTVKHWASLAQDIIAASKTSGNDSIEGTHFDDLVDGGAGNDRLEGGNGSDTYVFDIGYGADVVRDSWDNILSENEDRLWFGSSVDPNDVILTRYGAQLENLRISFNGSLDTLSIEGQFVYTSLNYRPYEIESIVFANNDVWSAADIMQRYLAQNRTAGADTIEGFWTSDLIEGGAGNDILRGHDGSDTYRFSSGFGRDRIEESVETALIDDFDRIEFGPGLAPADATLTRAGNDLVIGFAGTSDQVTVVGQFASAGGYGSNTDIERISFADGTVWGEGDIRRMLLEQARTSGNDLIEGFYAADVLDGGAGDDILRGSTGSDTYKFGLGYGHDVIEESLDDNPLIDGPDTVLLGPGIIAGNVTFSHVGDDLVLGIAGATDTLTIRDHFVSALSKVEFFKFNDGTLITAAQAEANTLVAQSTSGNDTVVGTNGSDVIDGGAGNDILRGGDGSDTYLFSQGFGQDVIEESVTNSWIEDNDTVVFGAGISAADVRIARGTNINDLIISFANSTDRITIKGQFESAAWYGSWADIESFVFADGSRWTSDMIREKLLANAHTSGNDVIRGFYTADILDGGAGDDELRGSTGGDTYLFGRGSGHDTIYESLDDHPSIDGPDDLRFGAGISKQDVAFTRQGDDLLVSLNGGTDSVRIKGHFASTSAQLETFTFADGTVVTKDQAELAALNAQFTPGDDTVIGSSKNDDIAGGRGNDILRGGDGSDTYYFALGDGQDRIEESVNNVWYSDNDTLVLGPGITQSMVSLSRSGPSADLVISIAGTTDTITVVGQFASAAWYGSWRDIETIKFADGSVWSDADIRLKLLAAAKTSGNDAIYGFYTGDVLDGGAGNDTLRGSTGSDAYLFDIGYGQDTIIEGMNDHPFIDGPDTVRFGPGLSDANTTFTRDGADLLVRVAGRTDTLRVVGQFGYDEYAVVENFEFANGQMFTAEQVQQLVTVSASTIGNDVILGYVGDDALDGLAGDDLLQGWQGNDTYVFGLGYGHDTIQDKGSSNADKVRFKSGFDAANLQVSALANDLVITFTGSPGDTLTLKNQLNPGDTTDRIENFSFADGSLLTYQQLAAMLPAPEPDVTHLGTAASETLSGTTGNDVFKGLGGDDTLKGKAGSDRYIYASGDGNDIIYDDGETVDADTLQFTNLNSTDFTISRSGLDLLIRVNSTGQFITSQYQFLGLGYGLEQVKFANGTIWDAEDIRQAAWYRGTVGNDTLSGTSLGDTFYAKEGDDRQSGANGSDTYHYGAGFGADTIYDDGSSGTDLLQLVGLNAGDVTLRRSGNDAYLTVTSTGETLKLEYQFLGSGYGIEQLKFADGTVWGTEDIRQAAWYRGTTGNDTISGTGLNDTFYAKEGDDRQSGANGSDTYHYGAGFGADTIYDDGSSGTDLLQLVGLNDGDVTLRRSGYDAYLTVTSTGETLKLEYQFLGSGYGIEQLKFADGTVWGAEDIRQAAWYRGTSGDDTLSGSSLSDTLLGGVGNDTLTGNAGNDVFVFGTGFGHDTITDFVAGAASNDVIEFDDAVFADLSSVLVAASQVGADTVITHDANNTITLKNVTMSNLHQDDFRFV